MGATPICMHCGFQFGGFFLPEMLDKKCPQCGNVFDGKVRFAGVEDIHDLRPGLEERKREHERILKEMESNNA